MKAEVSESIELQAPGDTWAKVRRLQANIVGNSQVHFTWRAVAVGLVFGTILCFSNMYFGLQTGWISMMSLQSSLVGFAVFKALDKVLDVKFGPAENVVLQTTAVATATMPLAAGFVGILPAIKQLDPDETHGAQTELGYGQLCAWGLALTFFGVFFAVPLRKQTIIREKLRFPSGTATAQMISAMATDSLRRRASCATAAATIRPPASPETANDEPEEPATLNKVVVDVKWVIKLLVLLASFLLSGAYTLIAHFYPILAALPVFGKTLKNKWLWTLTPSLSYAGQGIIMGLPTCIWMLVGALVGWGVLSPIAKTEGWAPGPVGDWKNGSRGWILWVSLAVMIAESVVSLSLITPQPGDDADDEDVDPRYLVPGWVIWGGLLASTLLCMGIVKAIFNIPMYDTLIAVLLALPLAVLGVRALGETDLNPVSGIGKVSQVIFAGVMPGNIIGNLVAGGIAEAGAQQAGDLMQDLKTGHLLHASPRAQFVAQMIGSVFSVFVSAGAYKLYNRVYEIPGPQFPVPTGQVWLDMARLVNGRPLPPHVWPFIAVFSAIFVVLPILLLLITKSGKRSWQIGRFTRWWPSGIAFAIGIYNTPNFTLMRAIGAIAAAAEQLYRRKIGMLVIILASGFVLGEGTFSFGILLFEAFL
ncbi:OPT superfamily oligopeptide transporter [Linderina pennispora]|uniref:OPT superfamily oligopeptide transporter n=1 Tax=Linderina pennispora TaxID=61395 RepID=A0A1Y1VXD1_9FUNG|nr:OPT superfamily oligopeptide transporter [Linderina pennispora]ORX65863.1 OPT superfamily oligopeptide transporter [Linderina pennispora]